MDALHSQRGLQSNWDSYGAKPVDPDALETAEMVLTNLKRIEGIEPPLITATPEGHVGLCWDHGVWSLDAEVTPQGAIKYVVLGPGPRDERDSQTEKLRDLAEHLLQA